MRAKVLNISGCNAGIAKMKKIWLKRIKSGYIWLECCSLNLKVDMFIIKKYAYISIYIYYTYPSIQTIREILYICARKAKTKIKTIYRYIYRPIFRRIERLFGYEHAINNSKSDIFGCRFPIHNQNFTVMKDISSGIIRNPVFQNAVCGRNKARRDIIDLQEHYLTGLISRRHSAAFYTEFCAFMLLMVTCLVPGDPLCKS